jgi:hypothetical protein
VLVHTLFLNCGGHVGFFNQPGILKLHTKTLVEKFYSFLRHNLDLDDPPIAEILGPCRGWAALVCLINQETSHLPEKLLKNKMYNYAISDIDNNLLGGKNHGYRKTID